MADSIFIWPGASGGQFTGQSIGPAADNTAAPPFTFLGDLTTGYASSAVGTLSLVTAGTTRLSLNSTGATFADNVIGAFSRTALATTSTDGLTLTNATAATGGATVQISPRFRLRGNAWDTSATKTVDFFIENLPVSAATPTATFKLGYSLNGAAASYPFQVSSSGQIMAADGSVGAPSYVFASSTNNGFYFASSYMRFASGGTQYLKFFGNEIVFQNGAYQSFGAGTDNQDTFLKRAAANQLAVTSDGSTRNTADVGTATLPLRSLYVGTSLTHVGANAQSLAVLTLTELTTIAASATTDTTIQMPAGAIVLAVNVRVTTVIPTAATFTVGDSGSAARFSTAAVSTAATSTDAGTKAGAYYNASALSVRITPNLTPADNTGRVRVTIYYFLSTPPTS